MPAPIAIEVRRQIVERHESGETLASISRELQLSYNTVKKLWAHWQKHHKLSPNYEQALQKGTRQYGEVYAAAIAMKRKHPKWGAVLIQIKLAPDFPDGSVPSERTLQRWFRAAGINTVLKVRQSRSHPVPRGGQAHQVWAVDAKEQMRLADGSDASWLMVTDEGSGAILDAHAFPPQKLDKG